jgi:hypothetical protein
MTFKINTNWKQNWILVRPSRISRLER